MLLQAALRLILHGGGGESVIFNSFLEAVQRFAKLLVTSKPAQLQPCHMSLTEIRRVSCCFCFVLFCFFCGEWCKGDEERMWEENYFFIHFVLVMKKKHFFCLVRFFKQSGK